MRYYIIICALIFQSSLLYAATELQPRSRLLSLNALQESEKLQLPALDKTLILSASKASAVLSGKERIIRPLQVAQPNVINQSIKDIGQWQEINGETIWRLNISAKEALHLNIGFKNVFFPESARLFILDKNTGDILQQYSSKDNKVHGELWTPFLDTKDLQLEINLMSSEVDKLTLNLVQVAQGYVSLKPNQTSTKSGSCNIDVICPEGNDWRNEIRSVARYLISGAYLCTGTLINNTREDRDPLFLTAAHCEVSDTTASSMVFYWNYETSVCGGTPDGSRLQSQVGATFVSRWEGVSTAADFALVRLDNVPNANFNVFYAGWDNQDKPHTGVRGIHHPNGDEKRISVDHDALTITNSGDTVINPNANYLRVTEWDGGTTEGGSSGSGLWNLNHHLVGTLTGGDASCTDQTASDWYGRIATQWLGNNFESNQLAAYLAPNESSTTTLDGVDSCSAPTVNINVSNNIPMIGEQVSFTSTITGGSGGYSYQWDFNNDGVVDSTVANPIYTYTIASNNSVRLTVRDSSQCSAIARTTVLAPDANEIFLGDGLLARGFEKPVSVEGTWVVDDNRSSEGIFSLKSQIVNGNQSSSTELAGNYPAGTISFDYRVSSEEGFDFFTFYIDNIVQINVSGELNWTEASFPINAGNHQFRWVFQKDEFVSGGQDTSWIDNLQIQSTTTNSPPTVVTTIADQVNTEGDTASLDISANFNDADDDNLNFSMADGPGSMTIDSVTGIISGTLTAADVASSPYTVSITASDGNDSVTSTFSWTVNAPVNTPPTVVAAISDQVSTEGNTVSLDISNNFDDADGETLNFSMADSPGSLTVNSVTGIISGTLTATDVTSSPYTVTVTASDGNDSITSTFAWTVNALPAPPPPPATRGGGGSLGFTLLGLLFLSFSFRRKS